MIFNGQNAPAVLRALQTNLSKAYTAQLDATPSQWDQVAMLVPSTSAANDYAWMQKFPRMKEWLGEKTLKKLAGHTYTLKNRDFEATIEVDRNDIEDDNLGIYAPMAQAAGESAKQWPDELVFSCLTKGFVDKCYDGKSFYHTDHTLTGSDKKSRNESNRITKKLSIASLAEAQASYGAARTLMRGRKDEEGRPLNLMPNVLVVPPALEDLANTLMTTDRLEDGKPNPYKGTATVIVCAWLTTETEWHLLDTKRVIKPIVFQQRKKPVFVQQIDQNAEAVFMQKKFRFGAEARGEAGYGLWQLAVGSTGTT
jgi:phage major head subunit gpT-like protein